MKTHINEQAGTPILTVASTPQQNVHAVHLCPPGPPCPQGPPGPQQHFHQLKQIVLKLEKTKQLPFTLIDTQTTRTSMSITDNTLWVKSKSLCENTIRKDPDIMQRHLHPLPPITSWEEVFFGVERSCPQLAVHVPSTLQKATLNLKH